MQRGFTLVELIIYVSIISLIGTAAVHYTLGVSQARNKNEVTQQIQANGRTALQLVSQRIRGATGLNVASSTFDASPGVLTLTFATSTKNPTVIDLTSENGQLRIQEGTTAPVIITPATMQITNLTFTDLTSSSARANVRVQFTIEYINPSGDVVYDAAETFQTSVSVRQ